MEEQVAYLLTFWPPGPDDLLYLISVTLRGIRSALLSRAASHFFVADVSFWSLWDVVLEWFDADLEEVTGEKDWREGAAVARARAP